MVEKGPPGVRCIERVLGQHERAARCGGPRVDERNLDQINTIVETRDIAPCFVVDKSNSRVAIEMPGEIAEPPVDEIDDALVDFDPGDLALIEDERRNHVASAAGANDDDP